EEGLYAVLFDGDFVVSDGPRVAGERLPQVVGNARLKKGVIEFDFANQSEVQKRAATTQPLYWTYRIHAEAKNNLRWRTADADMEFDADLDLQQTPDSLLIYGEMHALRGQYWFLSNRFRVLNADLTFDNQQGVDPLLDIAAETRIPSAPGAPLETITAQLTGRSSKPVIALTSSANSDQRTILAALTVGSVTDERGTVSVQSPLDNYVTRQLNAQLSENLSAFFAGRISEWEVRRDRGGLFSGEGGIVVGVGSQVTDNLAFRYRQRLPGNERPVNTGRLDPTDLFDQNVEAEYRVIRFIFLTSGFSRRRGLPTSAAQTNTDYNVNLKARWEY
ncbi:MAG: translocation/assembly module TamB, partial [Candidatus Eisenbacteria bacterium]|nr:translocation/assembly module TamB [Candidatus Eisenbacteria bacterium]